MTILCKFSVVSIFISVEGIKNWVESISFGDWFVFVVSSSKVVKYVVSLDKFVVSTCSFLYVVGVDVVGNDVVDNGTGFDGEWDCGELSLFNWKESGRSLIVTLLPSQLVIKFILFSLLRDSNKVMAFASQLLFIFW